MKSEWATANRNLPIIRYVLKFLFTHINIRICRLFNLINVKKDTGCTIWGGYLLSRGPDGIDYEVQTVIYKSFHGLSRTPVDQLCGKWAIPFTRARLLPCYCLTEAQLIYLLTHWRRVTHICVDKLTTIGSDNGLSPGRRQVIIWTNAGILLIRLLGTNFSEILIGNQTFSFKKMHLKMSSAKWRPFNPGLNVLSLCKIISPIVWSKRFLKGVSLNVLFFLQLSAPLSKQNVFWK